MPFVDIVGLPGVRAPRTADYRRILRQGEYTLLAGGGLIDSTYARDPGNTSDVDKLRPGLIMGKRSADSYWAPSILGVTTNAEAIGSTSIEASAAVITELVRRVGSTGTFKLTGPGTAGGVVNTETVTYSAASGTTITCTAIVNAYVAGSFIQPTDGSETPVSFIPDGWNIKVTDLDGNDVVGVQWPQIPVAGMIDESQLINWPSDASLKAWLYARLNGASGGQFVFDGKYIA